MATPLEDEGDSRVRPNRTVSAPPRASRPRRTLSLSPAVLVRVRGAIDRRARTKASENQATLQVPSSPKPPSSTFPDLVLQIMRRGTHGGPEASNEGKNHIPHMHLEGGKTWEEFNSHAMALEKDLHKFEDAVKELGSSLELTGTARNLRHSISSTARLFQENARKLFPRVIPPSAPPRLIPRYSQRLPRSWPPVSNPQINTGYHPDRKPIHDELKAMATNIECLRVALEHFSEFGDTEDLPLMRFEGDLKYWSSCLERYEGQFESREVQQYIHDLSRELGAQFEDTGLYLKGFIDSVPTVRLAQKHLTANLQNLATIATFFSAVTATTLQYSFTNNNNGVSKAVNAFWFNSLIFSIASALNSFLVLTWRRAHYSSPRVHIPWWLWIWILRCPPVFLLISVVTFLTGLGCFSFSSRQAHVTSVIVIISETISAFGLAALLGWLAYDKWSFYRRQNHLSDLGFASTFSARPASVLPTHHKRPESASIPQETFIHVHDEKPENVPLPLSRTETETGTTTSLSPEQRKARARRRWIWVCEKIVFFQQACRKEWRRELVESRHMDKMDARVRKFAVLHELSRCEAGTETRDIQFDPQGKVLAICRDSLSMRFDLSSATMHESPQALGQALQVVWTSSSEHLVTRKSNAIHDVWQLSGPSPGPQIFRDSHDLLSLPPSEGGHSPRFLSLEPMNRLAIVDITGNQHWIQGFKGICIQHVDIFPNGSRVLIAAVMPHVEGHQPTKASPGRKLMVFNLKNRQIEHEVPLWHDVQHVTISGNGRWAVVSFKDFPPPQLWLLQETPIGVRLSLERQFCARERVSIHEFDPGRHIRFSGRAHFFGDDRYILCATVDGKIHMWRRDKSHPVHINGGLTLDKDKPVQIACNKQSSDFMFATRSYDGTVRIWKTQDQAPKGPASAPKDPAPTPKDPTPTPKDPPQATLKDPPQATQSPPQAPPTIRIDTTRVSSIDSTSGDATRLVTLSPLSESPQGSPQSEESLMVLDGNSQDHVDPVKLPMLLRPPHGLYNEQSGRSGTGTADNNTENSTGQSRLSSPTTAPESPQGSPSKDPFASDNNSIVENTRTSDEG